MPNAPSLIWGGTPAGAKCQVDPVLVQDAQYRADKFDRAYIDSQIRGLETHVVQSLVGGVLCTWMLLDPATSAGAIGYAVCLSGKLGASVTVASAAPLAAAGCALGVLMSPPNPGTWVRVAIGGSLLPTVTGLPTFGGLTQARVTPTGALQAVAAIGSLDYSMGLVDAVGNLSLRPAPLSSYSPIVALRRVNHATVGPVVLLSSQRVFGDVSAGPLPTIDTPTTPIDNDRIGYANTAGDGSDSPAVITASAGQTIEDPSAVLAGTFSATATLAAKSGTYEWLYDAANTRWKLLGARGSASASLTLVRVNHSTTGPVVLLSSQRILGDVSSGFLPALDTPVSPLDNDRIGYANSAGDNSAYPAVLTASAGQTIEDPSAALAGTFSATATLASRSGSYEWLFDITNGRWKLLAQRSPSLLLVRVTHGTTGPVVLKSSYRVLGDVTGGLLPTIDTPTAPLDNDRIGFSNTGGDASVYPVVLTASAGQTIEDPGAPTGTFSATATIATKSASYEWLYDANNTRWKLLWLRASTVAIVRVSHATAGPVVLLSSQRVFGDVTAGLLPVIDTPTGPLDNDRIGYANTAGDGSVYPAVLTASAGQTIEDPSAAAAGTFSATATMVTKSAAYEWLYDALNTRWKLLSLRNAQTFLVDIFRSVSSCGNDSTNPKRVGGVSYNPADYSALCAASTIVLHVVLETTNAANAAALQLVRFSGAGSPAALATLTTTALSAGELTVDVSTLFRPGQSAGIFVCTLYLATASSIDLATCSGAWLAIAP